MKKEILFVLLPEYADWEGAHIASYLHNTQSLNGDTFETKVVGLTKDPVVSIGGFKTLPDYDIHSLPDQYGALILVGGMSWLKDEAKPIVQLVKDAIAKNILVAGICNASVFLGKYGFLNQVKHTSNTLKYLLENVGEEYQGKANYIEKQAVRDGNMITANGTAELEFAREIQLALQANTPEEVEKLYKFKRFGFCKD